MFQAGCALPPETMDGISRCRPSSAAGMHAHQRRPRALSVGESCLTGCRRAGIHLPIELPDFLARVLDRNKEL